MYKTEEEAEENEFPNKFDGSSKHLEADAILKILENIFCHCYFFIDVIISENDIKMQSVLKHASKGPQDKFLKSSKSNLNN